MRSQNDFKSVNRFAKKFVAYPNVLKEMTYIFQSRRVYSCKVFIKLFKIRINMLTSFESKWHSSASKFLQPFVLAELNLITYQSKINIIIL